MSTNQPLTEKPALGTECFVVDLAEAACGEHAAMLVWDDSDYQNCLLKHRLLFAQRDDAEQAAKDLLPKPRRLYTVLLLRPDYVANEYGQDTWFSFVEAGSVGEAQAAAQQEVAEVDGVEDFNDYFVLAVFEGRRYDVKEMSAR